MKSIRENPASYARSHLMVGRTKIPDELEIHDELGKGTNNRVYKATYMGHDCVLRVPRRRSDTQQHGSAIWEFRHTLKAAQLGVGPDVYRAWCARHASGRWPSGLYVITERFSHDLETVLCEDGELQTLAIEYREEIETAIVHCLEVLANEKIFMFDIKPSNIVLRFDNGTVTAKIIDFGRDFCEWAGCEQDPDSNTPNVDMVRKRILARDPTLTTGDISDLTSHILLASMLIILGSTTTRCLYEERGRHRMASSERHNINPIVRTVCNMMDSMQGRNINLVRDVLRMDEVRGVLRHYHGRRDSGTHRTFALARGLES